MRKVNRYSNRISSTSFRFRSSFHCICRSIYWFFFIFSFNSEFQGFLEVERITTFKYSCKVNANCYYMIDRNYSNDRQRWFVGGQWKIKVEKYRRAQRGCKERTYNVFVFRMGDLPIDSPNTNQQRRSFIHT